MEASKYQPQAVITLEQAADTARETKIYLSRIGFAFVNVVLYSLSNTNITYLVLFSLLLLLTLSSFCS
jgi:hypothetical protein